MIGAVIRNTLNPTMLNAGYKVNVIPSEATAHVDGRFLPGYEDEFWATFAELCGEDVTYEAVSHQPPWETPYDGGLVDSMTRSLLAEDPDALVAPFLLSAGTDAKHFTKLGMRSYGFVPLRLPEDLDFTALFHGSTSGCRWTGWSSGRASSTVSSRRSDEPSGVGSTTRGPACEHFDRCGRRTP